MSTLRIVLIALVRADGSVLLRLRDEQSVTRPNRWSLPGGAAEPGEEPEAAARRIVLDQTGLTLAEAPEDVWHGYLPGVPAEVLLFAARCTARADDVADAPGVVSEFVAGEDVRSGRSFTEATGYVLTRFIDAPRYQALLDVPDAGELA